MIIWQGRGWIAPVVTFATLMVFEARFNAKYGEGHYSAHNWVIGLGLITSGALIWMIDDKLNKTTRTLVDQATGETVTLLNRGTRNRGIRYLFPRKSP